MLVQKLTNEDVSYREINFQNQTCGGVYRFLVFFNKATL